MPEIRQEQASLIRVYDGAPGAAAVGAGLRAALAVGIALATVGVLAVFSGLAAGLWIIGAGVALTLGIDVLLHGRRA